MANVLFTNVRILDGSGSMPYAGEVLVQGNRIARLAGSSAPREADLRGDQQRAEGRHDAGDPEPGRKFARIVVHLKCDACNGRNDRRDQDRPE
ncbi:hypothetical protein FHP25_32435 [Vineibacter terrae]|uniref:Uncharacterized protein n=1 Tax=Vineibacter terrae TaxID=2586908 RepID=A0A5C8PAW6_9HYPH|nr:hypothetical protein FHP25_32435 [Vineibacter terrae]